MTTPNYEEQFARLDKSLANCDDLGEFFDAFMSLSEQLDADIRAERISHERTKAVLKRSAEMLLRANRRLGRWKVSA